MEMLVRICLLTACCSILLDFGAKGWAKTRAKIDEGLLKSKEAALGARSSIHFELIQVAADTFSSGLIFIIFVSMMGLSWVSAGAAAKIVQSPLIWALLVLHLSCLLLSGHVMKLTASRVRAVGLCWQLLGVMCVVFPRSHDGLVVGLSNCFLLLVPASVVLLDYKHSIGLSFASTGIALWWHVSAYASALPDPQHLEQSVVLFVILDGMAFLGAVAAASALQFLTQQCTTTLREGEQASGRVVAALSDAQVLLDSKLCIVGPAAKFFDMVGMVASDAEKVDSFLDFIREDERDKFNRFLQESCESNKASPAAAIHLMMRAGSRSVGVEVFHSAMGVGGHLLVLREAIGNTRTHSSCKTAAGSAADLPNIPSVTPSRRPPTGDGRTSLCLHSTSGVTDMSRGSIRELPELEKLTLDVDVSTGKLAIKTFSLEFADDGDIPTFIDYLQPRIRRPFVAWLKQTIARNMSSQADPGTPIMFDKPVDFKIPGTVCTHITARQVRFMGRPSVEGLDDSGSSETTRTPMESAENNNIEDASEMSVLQHLLDNPDEIEDADRVEEMLLACEEALARRQAEVQQQMQKVDKAPMRTYARVELVQLVQSAKSFP